MSETTNNQNPPPPSAAAATTAGAKGTETATSKEEQQQQQQQQQERSSTSQAQTRWDDMYNRLCVYKKEYGNCLVPNRYDVDPQLGAWVSTQRRHYKLMLSGETTPLSKKRQEKLETIGFKWAAKNPRHLQWESRYQALLRFKKKYGHTQVPINWEEDIQLANWVSTQRQEYQNLLKGRTTRLDEQRVQLLDSIGFSWQLQRGGRKRNLQAMVDPTDDTSSTADRPANNLVNRDDSRMATATTATTTTSAVALSKATKKDVHHRNATTAPPSGPTFSTSTLGKRGRESDDEALNSNSAMASLEEHHGSLNNIATAASVTAGINNTIATTRAMSNLLGSGNNLRSLAATSSGSTSLRPLHFPAAVNNLSQFPSTTGIHRNLLDSSWPGSRSSQEIMLASSLFRDVPRRNHAFLSAIRQPSSSSSLFNPAATNQLWENSLLARHGNTRTASDVGAIATYGTQDFRPVSSLSSFPNSRSALLEASVQSRFMTDTTPGILQVTGSPTVTASVAQQQQQHVQQQTRTSQLEAAMELSRLSGQRPFR